MDWEALFAVLLPWGPSAISSVLVVVVVNFIKKIDNFEKNLVRQNAEIQLQLETKIAGVKEQFNLRFKEMQHDLERVYSDHNNRILYIEHDYTKNDSFWRELSGWKAEINHLSDRFADQYAALNQNILQLANKRSRGDDTP